MAWRLARGWAGACSLRCVVRGRAVLADNSLGDEAGVAIAEALKLNKTLQHLNLECACGPAAAPQRERAAW